MPPSCKGRAERILDAGMCGSASGGYGAAPAAPAVDNPTHGGTSLASTVDGTSRRPPLSTRSRLWRRTPSSEVRVGSRHDQGWALATTRGGRLPRRPGCGSSPRPGCGSSPPHLLGGRASGVCARRRLPPHLADASAREERGSGPRGERERAARREGAGRRLAEARSRPRRSPRGWAAPRAPHSFAGPHREP